MSLDGSKEWHFAQTGTYISVPTSLHMNWHADLPISDGPRARRGLLGTGTWIAQFRMVHIHSRA